LLELRDINDELLTLKKLFGEQQEAIDKMLLNYERCGYGNINGIGFLHEAQMKLKDYLNRIKEMMESAERTRGDVRDSKCRGTKFQLTWYNSSKNCWI